MKSVDHFLRMGTSHKICEDYIISGNDGFSFVILSDGCSSSKNTDMGARILVHLAKQCLKNEFCFLHVLTKYENLMSNWIINNSENVAKTMGLNKSCLDATLLILYIMDDLIYVYIYGDGYLITVDLQDKVSFHEISYSNNAPYYLSYRIDERRKILYMKSNPTKMVITDGDSTPYDYSLPFVKELPINKYKGVFIASDGLGSFINQDGEKFGIEKILKEIISFKNINGEFMKRRMGSKKGVINTFQEQGITHYDDLSIGGFII
jgi:hypothetical protein